VDDDMRRPRWMRDDRRAHRHADIRGLTAPDQHHRPIMEYVVAGARLGHAAEVLGRRHRRRRPDAHLAYRQAGLTESPGEPDHDAPLLLPPPARSRLALGAVSVPGSAPAPSAPRPLH